MRFIRTCGAAATLLLVTACSSTQVPTSELSALAQSPGPIGTFNTIVAEVLKAQNPPNLTALPGPVGVIATELQQTEADLSLSKNQWDADAINRSQCFTQEPNQSYSVFDSLLTSSSLEQFQIQLSQYFGALANDPIVRVAIAIRLQTQYDVLTLVNSKPPVDQKTLNAIIAFLLAPDFTAAPSPLLHGLLVRPSSGIPASVGGNSAPDTAVPTDFRTLLIGYERDYIAGKFVNRFGTALSSPGISGEGIPDAEITGIITVLFEALFDYLERTPIPADINWDPRTATQAPKPAKLWGVALGSSGGAAMPAAGAAPASAKPGGASASTPLPTALAVMKRPRPSATSPSPIPIFGTIRLIQTLQNDNPPACGITDSKAQAIKTLASYFGQRMVAWNGMAAEFLSTVNLGALFAGTSFAIGDNKTAVDIFKASVEVISRRTAEQVLFKIFYATPERDFGDLMEFFPPPAAPAS
ncbi:MAG: hypothetical protein JO358_14895 [Alphaproteobacteria bacterium]|nr:hypothetical protein [Alphaproteobacteria bacterium]